MVDGDFQDRAQSLNRLILDRTDAEVPAEAAQRVIERHRTFWGYQQDLVESLVADRIDRSQYLESFNSGLSALMRADKQILGDRAYAAIFGTDFDGTDSVIDAAAFLAGDPIDDPNAEPPPNPGLW